MTDAEIIQAVRDGDVDAYAWLVERHQDGVRRLCLRMTGDPRLADDLTHEAFVEAWLKLAQVRDPRRLGLCLRTVALNVCRMWYRRRRARPDRLSEDPPAAEVEPESPALLARMSMGLAWLSAPHRMVLGAALPGGPAVRGSGEFPGCAGRNRHESPASRPQRPARRVGQDGRSGGSPHAQRRWTRGRRASRDRRSVAGVCRRPRRCRETERDPASQSGALRGTAARGGRRNHTGRPGRPSASPGDAGLRGDRRVRAGRRCASPPRRLPCCARRCDGVSLRRASISGRDCPPPRPTWWPMPSFARRPPAGRTWTCCWR